MIAYEPGQKIPIVLEADAAKPKEGRRTFWTTAMSFRDQKQFAAVREEIQKLQTDIEQSEKAIEVILDKVTNVENGQAVNFNAEYLETSLDERQIWELFVALRHNLAFEEKKS